MKLRYVLGLICGLMAASMTLGQVSVDEAMARLKEKQKTQAATRPATQAADEAIAEAEGTEAGVAATTQPAKTAGPQAGFADEHYDNGQMKARYAVNATGAKWGPYTFFSEDGKRIERGSYKNDVLDGTRQTFYPNGKVKLQENYKKGQLDGPLVEYDEKGNIARSAEYKAGDASRIGEFKDGAPVSDRTYVDGVLVYPRRRRW